MAGKPRTRAKELADDLDAAAQPEAGTDPLMAPPVMPAPEAKPTKAVRPPTAASREWEIKKELRQMLPGGTIIIIKKRSETGHIGEIGEYNYDDLAGKHVDVFVRDYLVPKHGRGEYHFWLRDSRGNVESLGHRSFGVQGADGIDLDGGGNAARSGASELVREVLGITSNNASMLQEELTAARRREDEARERMMNLVMAQASKAAGGNGEGSSLAMILPFLMEKQAPREDQITKALLLKLLEDRERDPGPAIPFPPFPTEPLEPRRNPAAELGEIVERLATIMRPPEAPKQPDILERLGQIAPLVLPLWTEFREGQRQRENEMKENQRRREEEYKEMMRELREELREARRVASEPKNEDPFATVVDSLGKIQQVQSMLSGGGTSKFEMFERLMDSIPGIVESFTQSKMEPKDQAVRRQIAPPDKSTVTIEDAFSRLPELDDETVVRLLVDVKNGLLANPVVRSQLKNYLTGDIAQDIKVYMRSLGDMLDALVENGVVEKDQAERAMKLMEGNVEAFK